MTTSKSRTVRELGGEVWAELERSFGDDKVNWPARNAIVDLVMGVLARHDGTVITNDAGLPVEPLPEPTTPEGH